MVGTYLVLRFPDGRLPSSRWRLVAGLAVMILIFWVFSEALLPGPLSETPGVAIANPFGIEAARELLVLVRIIGEVLNAIGVRASRKQEW